MVAAIDQLVIRGLTLSERRCFAEVPPAIPRSQFGIDQTRLARWRHWLTRAGKNPTGWNDFLADETITESELIALANCVTLKANAPEWTRTLRKICENLQKTKPPRQTDQQTVTD